MVWREIARDRKCLSQHSLVNCDKVRIRVANAQSRGAPCLMGIRGVARSARPKSHSDVNSDKCELYNDK